MVDGPTRWRRLVHEVEVTSTMDVALDHLRAGEAAGLVVVADHQTAGRGRRGRPWEDAEGSAGPGSLAVTATTPAPATAGLVPLAAGIAVGDAFHSAGAGVALKWPNDVLLAPAGTTVPTAKAAGILVERHQLGSDRDVVLVGCGLDLDWRGVDREGAATTWSSLAEATGLDVDRAAVLADVLDALDRRLEVVETEPEALLAEYRGWCATLGTRVRIERPDGDTITGLAVDVDAAGALVVRGEREATTVHAGDVHHLRGPST